MARGRGGGDGGLRREEGGEECWRAYRGIGHSWFLIESPPYYTVRTCVHTNTHTHTYFYSAISQLMAQRN